MKKVLVIILNYLTYELTLNLIVELKGLYDGKLDIMVIDNASSNESAEILEKKSLEYNYFFIRNTKNIGYASGNNIGLKYAVEHGYQYSWILNNDVELREKNILEDLMYVLEENSNVGCVGPQIYSLDATVVSPYVIRPDLWNMTFGILSAKKYREKFKNKSGEVYRIYGCCMLLKNDVMKQIDYMDERTFLYCEEDILAERMLNKGYISYYDAKVSILHHHSSTVNKFYLKHKWRKIIEITRSREIYLKEYRKFNIFARNICHLFQNILIYFR